MRKPCQTDLAPDGKPAGTRLSKRIAWGVILTVVASGLCWKTIVRSPNTPLLIPEGGAVWIKMDTEPDIGIGQSRSNVVVFRKIFELPPGVREAPAVIKGFRSCKVFVNGRRLSSPEVRIPWMDDPVFDLAEEAHPGANVLHVEVLNDGGHPAMLGHCEALGLRTGLDWEVSLGGRTWKPVAAAAEKLSPKIAYEFPNAFAALARILPFLLAVAALVVFILTRPPEDPRFRPIREHSLWRPENFRLLVMAAWSALCVNNLVRLPLVTGFDAQPHLDYIMRLAEGGRLPLASEGWQFFQPPLYYAVAAVWHSVAAFFCSESAALRALDLIPLGCGLAQIEFAYRALKPLRGDDRLVANLSLLATALLPLHIYISQAVGNEPLAGALMAGVICLLLGKVRVGGPVSPRFAAGVGVVCGLAILTKITLLLLLPVLFGAVLLCGLKGGRRADRSPAVAGVFAGATALVAGWFFVRNQLHFGRPIVGGWEGQNTFWWQDPTFRTPSDFLTFGVSLGRPVFAAFHGFWDGLYSSFWLDGHLSLNVIDERLNLWNFDWMLALAPLSAPLCGMVLWGGIVAARSSSGDSRRAVWFLLACAGSLFAGLLFLYLRVPNFSTVKGTYLVGLLPVYAVVLSHGLASVSRGRRSRAVAAGFVAAWCLTAYVAFLA